MTSSFREQRYRATRKASIIGAIVNIILAIAKLVFGVIGQSQALIADGIHSFSDLATDAMVLFAAKRSSADADEDHPYGHGRIETAFTVALALFLIAVAIGIIVDAGRRLLQPDTLMHPAPLTLYIAALSILANEVLFQYTLRIAKRIRSPMLRANAWHHRSDAISSVIVLVGVAGAMFGLDYLDAFASVGVALMIAKIGWDLGMNAMRELIDTGLEPERLAEIRDSIAEVEGVKDFHMLRTRRMGGEALVDVHVQVNPHLSVSEGHQIGEYVRHRLTERIDDVSDVTVHIDPENDQDSALCEGLPLRRDIVFQLRERWRSLLDPGLIRGLNLHYLSGKIHVEMVLPLDKFDNLEQTRELAQALRQQTQTLDDIGSVRVYFSEQLHFSKQSH